MFEEEGVGYGRPPVAGQFKPGRSGNPGGRPRKAVENIDVLAILGKPMPATVRRRKTLRPHFELVTRSLASRAMAGEAPAIAKILDYCEDADVFKNEHVSNCGIVLTVPKDWEIQDWREMYHAHGLPPWAGSRDGLTSSERDRRKAELR
jgi:hypothetical protein